MQFKPPALFLSAVVLSFLAAELVFRGLVYLRERERHPSLRLVTSPFYLNDSKVGFKYRPNVDAQILFLDSDFNIIGKNSVRTNSTGHISHREDPLNRSAGEYRIAALGDSYTGCLYNNLPWPDLLEDKLNQNRLLKSRMGVSRFKVINFGRDTVGINTLPAIYETEVKAYKPDLILVSFIGNDILRRPLSKYPLLLKDGSEATLICEKGTKPSLGNPHCQWDAITAVSDAFLGSKEKREGLANEILKVNARERVLSSSHFLLLDLLFNFEKRAQIWEGHLFNPMVENTPENVTKAIDSLRELKHKPLKSILVHIPLYQQIVERFLLINEKIILEESDLDVQETFSAFHGLSGEQLNLLFNLPYDLHFSDRGAQLYSDYLATLLSKSFMEDYERGLGRASSVIN